MIEIFYLLIPLLVVLISCINIGELTLFDITFLPIFFSIVFGQILLKLKLFRPQNIYIFSCYLIFLISFITNFSNTNIILDIGITLRSLLLFIATTVIYYFLRLITSKMNNPDLFLLKTVTFTGSFLVIFSIIQKYTFNLPRFSFPLTLEGVDPHLYGFSLMSLFVLGLSLIREKLYSKLKSVLVIILISQLGIILIGVLLTGSRGVFLYGFFALLPHIYKLTMRIFNNSKINKKILISLIFFITFALISGTIGEFGEYVFGKAIRIFDIGKIIQGEDVARSKLISDVINILQSPSSYTLFGQEFKTSLTDNGLTFYLLNFGLLGLIIFNIALLSIGFPKFFLLKNNFKTSIFTKYHILGIFFYNCISSESIVIPRCSLLISLSTASFLFLDSLNYFEKKRSN